MTAIGRNPDRLYDLLPALYRIADTQHDGQLRALLQRITEQADALHDNTQQLWDDFFIETCQRWVVPYIGELVGNIPLHDLDLTAAAATAQALFTDLTGPDLEPPGAIPTRADVAKTIYYRRRKGTPPTLEELARDVTGWDAHVVEFFTLLDWNQHLEHLRMDCHGCPDLRRVDVGDRVGGPWDMTTKTVDVRRINEWDGWYNIPNIGFFLWRLAAYELTHITPRAIGGTTWRLTFSPLGQDIPLWSAGHRELGDSRMANELTVQGPIRAAAFFEDLRAVPPSPPATLTVSTGYYGNPRASDASVVVFAKSGALPAVALPANEVECTNLDGWTAFAQPTGTKVLLDATRGRFAVPTGRAGQRITVSYFYGFSADMGGGEYDRSKWLVPAAAPILVNGGGAALDAAIALRPAVPRNVIQITDSSTYDITTNITLATNESLTIQAANEWRPHLRMPNGSIAILTAGAGASLTLGGLLIEGALSIEGDLDTLRVLHCTFVPGRSVEREKLAPPSGPSIIVTPTAAAGNDINTRLEVEIAFSIVGALRMPSHITKLWLLDSIVDGILQNGGLIGSAVSDAALTSGPPAHIERSTLFGTSRFLKLEMASESIFTDTVLCDERQQGCVRFSFVPRGSATPQQYRCQPALETQLEQEKKKADSIQSGTPLPPGWETVIEDEVATWLVPAFETDRYGRPDFAQLRLRCPIPIRTGAEDGSEMGAFCVLKQAQRESNLRLRLDEYLPVGLEAGLIYVT
jgi:hypothetical protein